MRHYAELLADERKKLFRIMTLIFCAGQMFSLLIRFSHHWNRMESLGHWTAIECLVLYPVAALISLKRNADPVIIAFMAYCLTAVMVSSLVFW